jgi:hypothetical protein
MDLSACDIGCDEYGYPIHDGSSPSDLWALEWTPREIEAMLKRRINPATFVRLPLIAVSSAGLAAGTVPSAAPEFPNRALFCQRMSVGIR